MLRYITTLSFLGAVQLLAASILSYLTIWIIYTRFFHPLSRFPGPFLASVTDWWYFVSARWPIPDNTRYPLHRRYKSKIVRIRPNGLSISDPAATDVVFGTKPKWGKTEFYAAFDPHIEGGREIFSLMDEGIHTSVRRTVGHLWTLSEMTKHEPQIDRLIAQLRVRLASAAGAAKPIDLPRLFNQYTLDVLGEVFWGKDGGFGGLQHNIDYKNWTEMLTNMIPSLSVTGLAPWGAKTLYVLSQLLTNSKVRNSLSYHDVMIADAKAIVAQRSEERKEAEKGQIAPETDGRDMTSKMLDLVETSAEKQSTKFALTQGDVDAAVYDAIIAGFDTTGLSLTHIMLVMLQHPVQWQKLQREIDAAYAEGRLKADNVRYQDCIKLPYFNACVCESLRMSSPGSLGQVRRVPPGGASLSDGTYLPAGIDITINPECSNFDPEIFGDDAEDFRPERWIENDPEKIKTMEKYFFLFGFGARVCLGKFLAQMEIWKMFAVVMKDFDFELVSTPKVNFMWFKRVEDFWVKLHRRQAQ